MPAIRAQIFNADGTAFGTEFVVNAPSGATPAVPDIAVLADGGFVIGWTATYATGSDTSARALHAQRFTADGVKLGAEFQINTTTLSDQYDPDIATLEDGRFVVVWSDFSQSGADLSNYAVRAQVFNADGSLSGAEFVVNTTTANEQSLPSVAALAGGGFAVAWWDGSMSGGDQSATAIRAQVYTASGLQLGGEFLVNFTTLSDQFLPSITTLANGRFVVVWEDFSSTGLDTSQGAIRAQMFEPDGTKFGFEFLVNSTTLNLQSTADVVALPDGRFMVVWDDHSQASGDLSQSAIHAQVFDGDGNPVGREFRVNTTTAAFQYNASVAALADGRVVVTWDDGSLASADADGVAVFAQILDPRVAAVVLNGTVGADGYVGTAFADLLDGYLGNDTLSGASGDDRMAGGSGDDSLSGGGGTDRMAGDDGNDTLTGGNGSDGLDGGAGNDLLNGGLGLDASTGGAGNDIHVVDAAGDLVIEASGTGGGVDRVLSATLSLNLVNFANVENATLTGLLALNLTGSAVANLLTGNGAANRMFGLGDNDVLAGGAGNDTLEGGVGADSLRGGTGQDLLVGGMQADMFVFASAQEAGNGVNRDQITDFQAGEDKIDFSAFMAGGSFIGNGAFVVGGGPQVRFVPASGLVSGDVNGDGLVDFSLQLHGSPVLTAADVLF